MKINLLEKTVACFLEPHFANIPPYYKTKVIVLFDMDQETFESKLGSVFLSWLKAFQIFCFVFYSDDSINTSWWEKIKSDYVLIPNYINGYNNYDQRGVIKQLVDIVLKQEPWEEVYLYEFREFISGK